MNQKIKIIHLEDLDTDAELVERELQKSDLQYEILWVKNKQEFIKALDEFPADIILSDHSLPTMNSSEALRLLKEKDINVPFILITATVSEEFAVDIISQGADDYILKDRLQRLPAAINNALEKQKAEKMKEAYRKELIVSERKFRSLIENIQDVVIVFDKNFDILYRSPNYERTLGWPAAGISKKLNFGLVHPDDREAFDHHMKEVFNNKGIPVDFNFRIQHKAGHYLWMEGTTTNLLDDESINSIIFTMHDVSEKKKVAKELQTAHKRLLFHLENSTLALIEWDSAMNIKTWSKKAEEIFGWTEEEFKDLGKSGYSLVFPEDKSISFTILEELFSGNVLRNHVEHRNITKSGKVIWCEWFNTVLKDEKGNILTVMSLVRDITRRKSDEERVRQSQIQLAEAQRLAKFGSWNMDLETDTLTWSDELYSLFGRSPGSFHNSFQSFLEFVDEPDRVAMKEYRENLLTTGESMDIDYHVVLPDGEKHFFHGLGHSQRNEAGKITRLYGLEQDITEHQHAAEEIEMLSLVASKTNNGVMITDVLGRIEWVNDSFMKLSGYSLDEIKGLNSKFLQGPETDSSTIKRISDKLKKREFISEEIVNYSKNGNRYWLRLDIAPVFGETGQLKNFVSIQTDITALKESEKSITSIAKELSGLIENANVPIFGVDRNGYINEWNRTTIALTEFDRNDVLGKKWVSFLGPEIREEAQVLLQGCLAGKSAGNYELPMISKHGAHLTLLIGISARRDSNQNVVGAICVGQDITEVIQYRKGLEKLVKERTHDLNKALKKEHEVVEMKSKFVSIASHEFRTPLSTISLATGFIRKYKKQIASETIDKKLENIEKQVGHMVYLLDDILLVGRAEAGKIKANLTEIEIKSFERLAIEVIKGRKTAHKLQFVDQCEQTTVFSDEKLIRNIILNLVSNAVKFSPDADKVVMKINSNKKYLTLIVRDYGIGIPARDMKNLFISFSRGSNVNNIEGTGLGLSIVKKAVEILNGTIEVKRARGLGMEFKVTLPLHHA